MHPGLHVGEYPDKPAVVMAATGARQTFAELDSQANRLSRFLRAAGIAPSDHVAICLDNHPRLLEVLWGCHYAGAVYTACSTRLTAAELAYVVDDCGARVFITSVDHAAHAEAILASTPGVEARLMIDGVARNHGGYEAALADYSPAPLEGRVAGADMLYSSGTTGRPKGVAQRRALGPLDDHVTGVETLARTVFAITADDVYLTPAPLYHAAPLRFTMAVQALGATTVVMDRFDAERCLAAIERYRVTVTQMVPTMFVRLLRLPPAVRGRYDLSSLRSVIHAAAPCPPAIKREIIDWMGPIVHEYYAGTEGNGVTYCDSATWLARPGTVGTPIGCAVHICDESGAELPAGATGTVYFEGGRPFEYHNDPDTTMRSRNDKGWTTLGDIGHVDADGYLYLTDRNAFTAIIGGVNVYPQEAENVLLTHPAVVDAAVFGIPHPEYGEELKAVVQPARMPAGDDEARSLENELLEYCLVRLARVKCPRTVDFRADLPRQPTGKLHKRVLKDEYAAARPGDV